MKKFVDAAETSRLRCFFFNAPTVDTGMMAKRANFHYVAGPGVAPAMPVHGKIFSL